MNVERYLRMIAGIAVLASLTLGYYVHPAFFLFTAFVGLNLLQSAFSDWCPVKTVLEKIGIPGCTTVRDFRHTG